MRNLLKKISILLLSVPFMAVTIDNPATGFFSTKFGTEFGGPDGIIVRVIQVLLGFAGLIALVYIILGGFQMVTSQGNDETIKKGKKTLTNAIIGLVIILLSYIIVTIVVKAAFGNFGLPQNTPPPPPNNMISV
jgi:hypothetical protein